MGRRKEGPLAKRINGDHEVALNLHFSVALIYPILHEIKKRLTNDDLQAIEGVLPGPPHDLFLGWEVVIDLLESLSKLQNV